MSDKPKLCLVQPSGGKGCISLGCKPEIINLWISRQLAYHDIDFDKNIKQLEQTIKDQQEVIWLAHEHMKLYLSHYKEGHNVYDELEKLKEG